MISIHIFDIRDTMLRLLAREDFDAFYLEEAQVVTFGKLHLSGRRNRSWYDQAEKEMYPDLPDWLYWKEVKPFIFQYIKGKKTPASFQISLRLSERQAQSFQGIETDGISYLMHLRYEQENLFLVSGCSRQTFSMDKRQEFMWDETVQSFLRKKGIAFETMD